MPEMVEQANITEEPIEISKGERKDLLDLVEEKQRDRATAQLKAAEVPRILLPYQQAWNQDDSEVRLFIKSRRIGASWGCFAAEGALEAARGKPYGMNQFYMGYNQGMAAENIGDAAFWAKAYGFALSEIDVRRHREHIVRTDAGGKVLRNETKDITTYKIKFDSDNIYEALSSNPFNWRGRQGHARIDEAEFHNDLGEVIEGALAYLMWGGRVSIASTVLHEDGEFWQYVREIQAGKLDWSLHMVTLDDALRDGLYKRICLVRQKPWSQEAEDAWRQKLIDRYPDKASADAELFCIPKKGSGIYFPRILLENVMQQGIPFIAWSREDEFVLNTEREAITRKWCDEVLKPILDALPKDQRSVYAQDFARSGDLSVIWILLENAARHWRQHLHLELRNLPHDVQVIIRDYIMDRLPLMHGAGFDARGNGSQHAESAQQKYGLRVKLIKQTAEWYAVEFPAYKSMMEDGRIVLTKSEDIIADHRLVELYKGRPRISEGRTKGSDGGYRHGDSASTGVIASSVIRAEGEPAYGETIEDDNPDELYVPESARGRRRVAMFGRKKPDAL
ncbi:MAG: hypothetical protein JMN25_18075 [gamma proteobacterium endosymbiont of Lamellibrachia anaximandri]|nr:hypothetical protein [gamma proteobacterium endosymbiont of Lamellibrachia anaximandri]